MIDTRTRMEEAVQQLSKLSQVCIDYHPDKNMYAAYFSNVFGKRKKDSDKSPRFFSHYFDSAILDLFNFYKGCEAIFVDETNNLTNMYIWDGSSFVYRTSYNRS